MANAGRRSGGGRRWTICWRWRISPWSLGLGSLSVHGPWSVPECSVLGVVRLWTKNNAPKPEDLPDLMRGLLIAFEGLDQSGKQTQAERLRDRVVDAGRLVRLLSFPAYDTPIGTEIGRALQGERDYGPDVMQLLYVANRYEWKPQIEFELKRGTILICDRYLASSIAYGEAQGLDAAWLVEIQKYLPQPDVTFLLDMDPQVSARR